MSGYRAELLWRTAGHERSRRLCCLRIKKGVFAPWFMLPHCEYIYIHDA